MNWSPRTPAFKQAMPWSVCDTLRERREGLNNRRFCTTTKFSCFVVNKKVVVTEQFDMLTVILLPALSLSYPYGQASYALVSKMLGRSTDLNPLLIACRERLNSEF